MTRQPGRHRPDVATAAIIGLATALAGVVAGSEAAAGAAPSHAAGRPAVAAPAHVRTFVVGGMPYSIAVDSRLRTAWVATGPDLVRISEATQRITARMAMNPGIRFVAVDPRTRTVWATGCAATCSLVEVSETTNRVVHRLSGLGGGGLAIDPRTGLVWVASRGVGARLGVQAISEASHRVARTIVLRADRHHQTGTITVDPRTGTVWASVIPADPSTSLAWVSQISESTRRVIRTYSSSVGGTTAVITAVDSRRGTAWLAFGPFRWSSGTIKVINIAKHRVLRTIIDAPVAPEGLAIDSRTGIVVATRGFGGGDQNSVVLIGESSGKMIRQIRMRLFPAELALDPATGNVYVPIVFHGVVAEFHE